MEKLRVGIIGAGGMADTHLPELEKFADVHIAAFCDVVLERAQEKCQQYPAGAPAAFADPHQMLQHAGLDACFILLPPFAHGEAERACLANKVPFFVEKPIGLDKGLIGEISREVQTHNLLTSAGYMNRYHPSVQAAREMFRGDTAVMAYGGWLGGPPTTDSEYLRTRLIGQWWSDKSKSGGQFVEQVTHTVDLVRYFLGEAVEVFAHATTAFNKNLPNLLSNYTMDDCLLTTVKFAGGAVANIMASSATPVGGGIFLNVLGMKSAALFTGWDHAVTLQHQGDAGIAEKAIGGAGNIFELEDRAFLDAVKSGDRSGVLCEYPDAAGTALLALAADESAATGKPVQL